MKVAALIGMLGLGLEAGALDPEGVELSAGVRMPLLVLRLCIVVPAASGESELVGVRFPGY